MVRKHVFKRWALCCLLAIPAKGSQASKPSLFGKSRPETNAASNKRENRIKQEQYTMPEERHLVLSSNLYTHADLYTFTYKKTHVTSTHTRKILTAISCGTRGFILSASKSREA